MKKNAMLKIAAILMVAVLLTTCAISSTFAKYVTSAGYTRTEARVADWGIEIGIASGNNLFKAKYGKTNGTATVEAANETDLVVAPGTSGSAPELSISGTAEVTVELSATANVELSGWLTDTAVNTSTYCPLVVTIDEQEYRFTAGGKLSDFEATLETAIVKALIGADSTPTTDPDDKSTTGSKIYEPNTDLAVDGGVNGVTISWSWAYTGNDDAKDTLLGKAADAGSESKIAFAYSVTATQVQPVA